MWVLLIQSTLEFTYFCLHLVSFHFPIPDYLILLFGECKTLTCFQKSKLCKKAYSKGDHLSLFLLILFPLIVVSNRFYFFVSFGKSKQTHNHFIISLLSYTKDDKLSILFCNVFCHLTIYLRNFSIPVYRDNLHSVLYSACEYVPCFFSPANLLYLAFKYFPIFCNYHKWSNDKCCAYCWQYIFRINS